MKYKYYKTKYKRLSANDVFVYLGGNELYCPIGQHSTLSLDYLNNDCKEITKEEYLKASEGIYTPEEYIK
jgi:hypothetical protein